MGAMAAVAWVILLVCVVVFYIWRMCKKNGLLSDDVKFTHAIQEGQTGGLVTTLETPTQINRVEITLRVDPEIKGETPSPVTFELLVLDESGLETNILTQQATIRADDVVNGAVFNLSRLLTKRKRERKIKGPVAIRWRAGKGVSALVEVSGSS